MKSLRIAALAATLPILLHACAKTAEGPVTAYVAKGPVTGAQCELRRASDEAVIAGPIKSEAGQVDFGVISHNGLGYVTCQGGTYHDEINGHQISLGQGVLRSAKMISGGAHFVVTPITEIAVRRALAKSQKGRLESRYVAQFNQEVADYFGLSRVDITGDNPTDIREQAVDDTPSGWYGVVLAGLSGLIGRESNMDHLNLGDSSSVIHIDLVLNQIIQRLSDLDQSDLLTDNLAEELFDLSTLEALPGPVTTGILAGIIGGLGSRPDHVPGGFDQALSVSYLTPQTVPVNGGFSIDLIGYGFLQDSMSIALGDYTVDNFMVHSDNKVSLITPPVFVEDAGGTLDLTIVQSGGNTYVLADALTVSCNLGSCTIELAGCPL